MLTNNCGTRCEGMHRHTYRNTTASVGRCRALSQVVNSIDRAPAPTEHILVKLERRWALRWKRLWGYQLKKMHNLSVENYVFNLGHYWGLSPRKAATQISLRACSKKIREEPECIGVLAGEKKKIKHVVEHQMIIANHKKQTAQVNDFRVLLCRGRCRNLSLLKSFFWYVILII